MLSRDVDGRWWARSQQGLDGLDSMAQCCLQCLPLSVMPSGVSLSSARPVFVYRSGVI